MKLINKIDFLIIFFTFLILINIANVCATPLPISGLAKYENNENAEDALVTLIAEGYSNETTTVLSNGFWQIDVGDPGPNWAEGTFFSVNISLNNWIGQSTGVVNGSYVNVGTVVLYGGKETEISEINQSDLKNTSKNNIMPNAMIFPLDLVECVEGEAVVFDASHSFDEDGKIIGFRWDFNGNGSFDTDWIEQSSYQYIFDEPGIYTVVLEVKDNNESTDRDSVIVDVSANPPVVEIYCPSVDLTSRNITFQAELVEQRIIENYTWMFGDDTVGFGQKITHRYQSPGNYVVKLVVTDDQKKMYHDVAIIDIKLDTDHDYLSNELENQIGSPIWTPNVVVTLQINGKVHYLIDRENDQIYDVFYNTTADNYSQVEFLKDLYLIDDDLDSVFDFSFNKNSGVLSPYFDNSSSNDTDDIDDVNKEKNQESPNISVFLILFSVFLMAKYITFRRRYK